MQSKVKLSKRQVKEDKFTTFMLTSKDKIQDEFEDKWQYYVMGLVLVVVVAWALGWHFSRQADANLEAGDAFARAMVQYQSGDNQVAILEFSKILDNYGGADVAAQAAFLLGNLNLEARNYTEAVRFYEMYLGDYGGNRLNRAAAYAGIASTMEDQAQYVEAADYYQRAIAEYPGGPLEADYLLGAFRTYLASGEVDQAQAVLDKLEKDHAGTEWTRKAQRRFAESKSGQ